MEIKLKCMIGCLTFSFFIQSNQCELLVWSPGSKYGNSQQFAAKGHFINSIKIQFDMTTLVPVDTYDTYS